MSSVSRSVGRSVARSVLAGQVSTLASLIKSIFANNEQGFAYDPNDLTTLYQDAAGTIPVTAAGQPVGLVLDKSKGLGSGSNAVLNGDFSQGGTGWVFYGGVTFSGGKAVYDGLNNPSITQYVQNIELGAFYKVRFTISNLVKDALAVRIGAGAFNFGFNQNKTYEVILPAIGANGLQFASAGSGAVLELSDISVKKLSGNHAYQTVSASRPILQQTPILGTELVVNGDFSNGIANWTASGCTFAVQNGEGIITATGGVAARIAQTFNTVIGKKYKLSLKTKKLNGINPAVGAWLAPDGGNTIYSVSSTFVLRTLEFTATTAAHTINIDMGSIVKAGEVAVVDNVTIKEVTGYRTDQNYLEFDGVDDFLQTNNIDFTATDKVSLFAGVRKLSDAASAIVAELSPSSATNNGSFHLAAPDSVSGNNYQLASRGTVRSIPTTPTTYISPTSNVVTVAGEIASNTAKIRVDGAQVAQSTAAQGTGNFGNYPLFIGRRGGTSLPFNGHLYSLIGISRLTTDAETLALEKAIAKATGVTLNV